LQWFTRGAPRTPFLRMSIVIALCREGPLSRTDGDTAELYPVADTGSRHVSIAFLIALFILNLRRVAPID
jgi:hypothetical protein